MKSRFKQLFIHLLIRCLNRLVPPQPPIPVPPSNTTSSNSGKPHSGYRNTKQIRFQDVDPHQVINESEESYLVQSGLTDGKTIRTMAISAEGDVVEPSAIVAICSVCEKGSRQPVRCTVTHVPLCLKCQCTFTKPNGEEIVVSPAAKQRLISEFNIWEAYTHPSGKERS